MDKLILSMPKNVIEKYLEEHNEKITFDDFLELRDGNINISSKLLSNNLELLKNKEVINYIFSTYSEIPEFIVSEIIKNDILITFEDVKNHEAVRNNLRLIHHAYNKDPRVIVLFSRAFMDYELARRAVKAGAYATEEDIIFNPLLKDIAPIMEASIKKDPKLIKYVTRFCGIQLRDEVVVEALSKYDLTKEDLINNPDLCGVYNIISKIPEYNLYSIFLTEEEKIAEVERLLKEKDFKAISKLPFFMKEFRSKASGDNIYWLAEFLTKDINEEDIFEQKHYQKILDYMIDGIIANMYRKNKFSFTYPDTVAIANDLKIAFYQAKSLNSEQPLRDFAMKLNNFVNMNKKGKNLIDSDYIFERINDIYNSFLVDESSILNNNATIFYNEVLNVHRNSYCSIEKSKALTKLRFRLPLTEKKKMSIHNGKKLVKITYLLATHKYSDLGITRDDIKIKLKEVEEEISNNKDIAKVYGNISPAIFEYFNTFFLNSGQLDYVTIGHTLSTTDHEVLQYIFKKYEQIKVDLLDRVELTKEEKVISQDQKAKLGLNVVNFNMASNEINLRNIATMLLCVTDENINAIKENEDYINEIVDIIPFADLIPSFDIETIIKILCNFANVKNKIHGFDAINNCDLIAISKFDDVIGLANGYDSMNNLYEAVLGSEIIEKIGVKDSKDYFEFYTKMRDKISCAIPRVSGEYDGKVYESGNFIDLERLVIGKNNSLSCIDLLNTAGRETFIECLAGTNGDVIMIRDKETRKFFARILIFRVGNMVQMACVYDQNGKAVQYTDEFFKGIADQIIKEACLVGDNIDYVFLTKDAIKETNFKQYENILFETAFPHADFWKYSYLVATNPLAKDKDVDTNLDFMGQAKCVYPKMRKPATYEASEVELTRLKALKVAMEQDQITKNELEKSFEPFYKHEYVQTISGEDWYVALRKDGSIEELVLPSNDPRTMIEFENAKATIRSLQDSDTELIRK